MGYTELDSILGQPVPQYVINQFYIRSKKTLEERDNNSLVYMANKSSWVRVISSVNISPSYSDKITRITKKTSDQDNLAKSFVLFGGTSAYQGTTQMYQDKDVLSFADDIAKGKKLEDYNVKNVPNYSPEPYFSEPYGNIDGEYGLRPIAGITSVKIATQGKLGSILQADIDFKVNTKTQLDIVDILYFKLGYTIFIEWGNTFFFKQKKTPVDQLDTYDVLQKSEDYAVDPFQPGMDEAKLRIKIAKAIRETDGNYDAMVGMVTNFSFTSNTEGGYDCKLKVIGPGMLAESMRTNAIPVLPTIFKDAIDRIANIITNINKERAEEEAKRLYDQQLALIAASQAAAKNDPNNKDNYPPCIRDRITSGEFQIVTEGNETFAKAKEITSELKDYKFFISSKYKKNVNGAITEAPFVCDGANIKNSADGKILNSPSAQALKFENFVKEVTTNTKRYRTRNDDKNPGSTQNLYVTDNEEKKDDQKHYYILQKQKTILRLKDISYPGKVLYPKNVKVLFNWNSPENLKNLGLSGASNVDWAFILGPKQERSTRNLAGSTDWLIQDNGTTKEIVPETKTNDKLTYFAVTDYDPNDTLTVNSFGNFPSNEDDGYYIIEYADASRGFTDKRTIRIRYSTKFLKVAGLTYSPDFHAGSVKTENSNEGETRKKIIDGIVRVLSGKYYMNLLQVQVNKEYGAVFEGFINIDNLPGVIGPIVKSGQKTVPATTIYTTQLVRVGIAIEDLDLVSEWQFTDPFIGQPIQIPQQTSPQDAAGTALPPPPEVVYNKIDAKQLQDSEAAMYKSQLEAMLRTIQLITISRFIQNDGTIKDVSSIQWTKDKDKSQLYELFKDGAFGDTVLQTVIESRDEVLKNKQNYYGDMEKKERFLINLLCGFHRSLMKDSGDIDEPGKATVLDELTKKDSEYEVNFHQLLQSFVIPYYQTKNLVEGGDIHYPTYVTLGFFFMMLNHCAFLYDTDEDKLNIPLFYLDFNQGSNIILSSDFMLSANPYRFFIPFTGDFNSYKKLFDKNILSGDNIIKTDDNGSPTKLWTGDGVSNKLPPFKFNKTATGAQTVYRGKLMNALVSIDYLLDLIKKHATSDESNSVYFRSLMDEILIDLGKALGNFNVLRLAYDDYSNCFYIVDDQAIPGENVLSNIIDYKNIISSIPQEIPLFGKESVARSFTIQTDMSTKIGNMLAVSANSEVKNQTTAGIDGTTIGNSSLYAIDRYKKAVTAVNDNSANKTKADSGSLQRKALAATRFNASVESYYIGGTRSEEGVEQATNYYIEAVAKARNSEEDPELKATMLLPLSVNFSTDGISGLGIYHAFTISENLLPYSYTVEAGGLGQTATRRVGFIVTGLDHTIENNSWSTNVKGSMYYVKNINNYKTKLGNQSVGTFRGVPPPPSQNQGGSMGSGGFGATGIGGTGVYTGDNGRLPDSSLTSIGIGSHKLRPDAAAAFIKMADAARKLGISVTVTDSYRTYETQNAIFDWDLYVSTGGNRSDTAADYCKKSSPYCLKRKINTNGGTAAAFPGTSNHGLGIAIDVPSGKFQEFVRSDGWNYGWSWLVEGAKINEPWHFKYDPVKAAELKG